MSKPNLANKKECTGCLACVVSCKKNALSSSVDEDGHFAVLCDTDKCVLCHKCEQVCPVVSDFEYKGDSESAIFAAWNLDDDVRKLSASGGAFSALASYILDQGGYVFGAANVGVCDIRHICINNREQLPLLQGSKYTQSDASLSYPQVLNLLRHRKIVLFSGTGCQVAGLLSFLRFYKYEGKLVTVDIICGGVPSKILIETFVANEPYKIKKIISFRTKTNGWKSQGFKYNLLVEDSEGNKHDYTNRKNLITDGFCSELTNRYSCYNCRFVGLERKSDFTIGDLWGDKKFPREHYNGLSLVVAHQETSIQLLNQMSEYLHCEPIEANDAVRHNYRLVSGKMKGSKCIERRCLSILFSKLSYSLLKHIYANDIKLCSPWILYKLYRKIKKIF